MNFFTASNMKTAAVAVLAAMLAQNLTAGKGTVIQAGATFGAVLLALPLAAKI